MSYTDGISLNQSQRLDIKNVCLTEQLSVVQDLCARCQRLDQELVGFDYFMDIIFVVDQSRDVRDNQQQLVSKRG